MKTNNAGRYASVNGLKLYYELHGKGEPLVLLHGGVGASEMLNEAAARREEGKL